MLNTAIYRSCLKIFVHDCKFLAILRYYESRQRIYNDTKPHRQAKVSENKQKAKRKGYQTRLYRRRDKAILTQEERALWRQLGEVYMTEESSDEENDCIRCHHLPWASNDLQELKCLLDQRVREKNVCAGRFTLKPRVESTPSFLPIPLNPVQWAVNSSSAYQSGRGHQPERDHQSGSGRDHRSRTNHRFDVGLTSTPSSNPTTLQSTPSPSLCGLLNSVQQQTPHNGRRPLCSITNGTTPRCTVRQRQSRVAFISGNVHRHPMNTVAPQSEVFISEPTRTAAAISLSSITENPDAG